MKSVSWPYRWPGPFSKWPIKWLDRDGPTLSEEPYDLVENTVTIKFDDGQEIQVTIYDRVPKESP